MLAHRRLCDLVLVLVLVLVPVAHLEAAPATKQPYALTLEFDAAPDHQADHICIVSAGAHPDATKPQRKTKKNYFPIGPPHASVPLIALAELRVKPSLPVDPVAPLAWQFREETLRDALVKSPLLDRPHLSDALKALVPRSPAAHEECTSGGEACLPSFEIALQIPYRTLGLQELHIACAPNVRRTGHEGDKSVAVVFLNLHTGIPPGLTLITLDGNVATLEFEGNVEDEVFVASVVGGHYPRGTTSTSVMRRIVLPLRPRCELYDVELPYLDARTHTNFDVELHEAGRLKPILSCKSPVAGGHARVRLPYGESVVERVLNLTAKGGLRFEATWTERAPPRPLHTVLRAVSLNWKRHCLYPQGDDCPAARLLDSGINCDEAPKACPCTYICDSRTRTVPIRLPESVRFTRADTDQRWTGRLNFSGQDLDEYLLPAEYTIRVRIPSAAPASFPIEGIELLFPNGPPRIFPFAPGTNRTEPAPDALCTHLATVRYLGNMPYDYQTARLDGGVIDLETPDSRRRPDELRLRFGVGHQSRGPLAPAKDFVQGWGDGAYLTLGMAYDYARANGPFFVELFGEFTGGPREYLRPNSSDPSTYDTSGRLMHFRLMAGPAAGYRFGSYRLPLLGTMDFRGLSTTLGLAGGASRAFNGGKFGDILPWHGVLAPTFSVRYHVSGSVSLSFAARQFLLEDQNVISPANVVVSSFTRNRFGWDLGLDFSYSVWKLGRDAAAANAASPR